MKTGFDNKRNIVILSVLGAVLIGSVGYFAMTMFSGGSSTPAPAPRAVSTEEPASSRTPARNPERTPQGEAEQANTEAETENGHAAKKVFSLANLDPTLHPELMAGAESLVYAGTGRNIFSMTSAPADIPKPVNNGRKETANLAPPPPTGPPPPPPIDLTFFGYEAGGGARKVFLLHGSDVFIASEGDVVDHHYKVVKISPLSIQVTDLLYNNTQTLNLSHT